MTRRQPCATRTDTLYPYTDLCRSADGALACKPFAGSHGDHVMIVERLDPLSQLVTRASGQQMTPVALHQILAAKPFAWVVQQKVRQHPALHDLQIGRAHV